MGDSDQKRGLYGKYFVQRLDPAEARIGETLVLRRRYFDEDLLRARDVPALPPPKHERCSYYVLDLNHDRFAAPALWAYAAACEAEYPALAADLRKLAAPSQETETREGGPNDPRWDLDDPETRPNFSHLAAPAAPRDPEPGLCASCSQRWNSPCHGEALATMTGKPIPTPCDRWTAPAPSAAPGRCCGGTPGCAGVTVYVDPGITGCSICGKRASPGAGGADAKETSDA